MDNYFGQKLRRGSLGKYGIKDVKSMTKVETQAALKRAVRGIKQEFGISTYDAALKVYRKLIAVSNLQGRKNPENSIRFRRYADWLYAYYKMDRRSKGTGRRSAQRKSSQRKSAQRKSSQRKSAQRKSAQRKSAQRKSAQRKSAQRKSAQRKTRATKRIKK
jgi:Mg-chelatase subunit ChlI